MHDYNEQTAFIPPPPPPFLKIMALGPEILGSWVELMCYSCPNANWHETYMVGVLHCFIRYAYVVFPVTN